MFTKLGGDDALVKKWAKVLDAGKAVEGDYTRRITAQLLENQAKQAIAEMLKEGRISEEALTPGATTVGQLGTFQKFAFPIVRRVIPELISNKIVSTQPMQGPVSQIFYLGYSRGGSLQGTYGTQVVYSKYNLTYRGGSPSGIGSIQTDASGTTRTALNEGTGQFDYGVAGGGMTGVSATVGFDLSNVLSHYAGSTSATYDALIAAFPDTRTILGWNVSAGEQLRTSGIPEITIHIQQQPVTARTRKMRTLWTLEAAQDAKAYYNLDLEKELTDTLSNELRLEIDREVINHLRMIAYGDNSNTLAGWVPAAMDNSNSNNFQDIGGHSPNASTDTFAASAYNYDFGTDLAADAKKLSSNVFVFDMSDFITNTYAFAPQHLGHAYANLAALINFAAQDIYVTTQRGPGRFLVTSPYIATMLHSAAKLEGGVASEDGPSNMGQDIAYQGKWMGLYDLYVDPLFPTDEILMGYNGTQGGIADTGYVYCPYIPLMQLPTITDPETFQPRKGVMTRYASAGIQPMNRYYRVIRVIGSSSNYLYNPFARATTIRGSSVVSY